MASELGVQTIQHTNGTDALTIDSSGRVAIDQIQIPSFMVEAAGTDQSYQATASVVVEFPTVRLDTESAWDATNHRYQPSIEGWYTFSGAVRCSFTSNPEYIAVQVVKNGADYSTNIAYLAQYQMTGGQFTNGTYPVSGSMIYLNGSTDYVNLSFRAQYSCTLHQTASLRSWFCGQLVKAGS